MMVSFAARGWRVKELGRVRSMVQGAVMPGHQGQGDGGKCLIKVEYGARMRGGGIAEPCQQIGHGMAISEPTPEMIAFYERRTREHIDRVRRCLHIMASLTDCADELNERARTHDQSKFGREERIPYVWLTEFHRCRRSGEPFTYPDGVEECVRAAIHHHVTTNRHHPDFHGDANEMTDADLIEMVCDWTAMAQEFGQDGGSARGWADRTIGHRLQLNEERRQFVYDMIELLDSNLGTHG